MVHSFCTCSFGGVRYTAPDKIRQQYRESIRSTEAALSFAIFSRPDGRPNCLTHPSLRYNSVSRCCVDVCEYCKEVACIPRTDAAASKFRSTGAFINHHLPPLKTDVFLKMVKSTEELVDSIDKLLQEVTPDAVADESVFAEIDEKLAKIDKHVKKFTAVYEQFVDKTDPYLYWGVSLFETVQTLPVKHWKNRKVWEMCQDLHYGDYAELCSETNVFFEHAFYETTNYKDEKIKGMIGEFRV